MPTCTYNESAQRNEINGDLPAPLSLQTELHCWKHKWFHVKTDNLPDSPIGALNKWDSRLFPNIEN